MEGRFRSLTGCKARLSLRRSAGPPPLTTTHSADDGGHGEQDRPQAEQDVRVDRGRDDDATDEQEREHRKGKDGLEVGHVVGSGYSGPQP